jgi:hypothetical protein
MKDDSNRIVSKTLINYYSGSFQTSGISYMNLPIKVFKRLTNGTEGNDGRF